MCHVNARAGACAQVCQVTGGQEQTGSVLYGAARQLQLTGFSTTALMSLACKVQINSPTPTQPVQRDFLPREEK